MVSVGAGYAKLGFIPIVDTFGQQPATLSLGSGQLSPAIEERLLGLAEGDGQGRYRKMGGTRQ